MSNQVRFDNYSEEGLSGETLISSPSRAGEPTEDAKTDLPIRSRRSSSFGIFIVCMVFGFLLAVQFKSVGLSEDSFANSQLMRIEELQSMLNRERTKNQELYEELLSFKDDVASYREMALQSGDYAAVIGRELVRAELIAGITDVEGPGIIVTMNDSTRSISADQTADPNLYIVHDDDLLKVVNELRDAGAEAISINNERLIATSEIRCAGSIVSVNNNRYAAPFVIRAIGDAQALDSALRMRGGVIDQLAFWGIQVNTVQRDSIVIRGYTGRTSFKHAREYRADEAS